MFNIWCRAISSIAQIVILSTIPNKTVIILFNKITVLNKIGYILFNKLQDNKKAC